MKKNILLSMEYDGTNFFGWQRQPGKLTIQGEIERVLSDIAKKTVEINGTSRTDAGVHALAQKATFAWESGIPTEKLSYVMNNLLSGGMNRIGHVGEIRIVSAEEVPEGFHARFSCKGKKYVYRIYNSENVDIFNRNYQYQVKKLLDVTAMRKAAGYIVGKHDFKCFQSAGGEEKANTVRTVFGLEILQHDNSINIEIKGDGFLYNMVRIITGTLVEVGHGKISPESVAEIITSKNRGNAGHTAPPQGLYLAEVYFDENDLKSESKK